MSHPRRFLVCVFSLATVALGPPFPEVSADAPSQAASGPETARAVDYALSRPAGELPASNDGPADAFRPSRINPLANEPDSGQRGTWDRPSVPSDPLLGPPAGQGVHTPVLDFDFAGVGNPQACGGCTPPDPNGDVGPDHYVQMVNATKVAIFDKTGMLLAPAFNQGQRVPRGRRSDRGVHLRRELREPEQHLHPGGEPPDRALHVYGLRLFQLQTARCNSARTSGSTWSASGPCTASPIATSAATRPSWAPSPLAAVAATWVPPSAGSSCARRAAAGPSSRRGRTTRAMATIGSWAASRWTGRITLPSATRSPAAPVPGHPLRHTRPRRSGRDAAAGGRADQRRRFPDRLEPVG